MAVASYSMAESNIPLHASSASYKGQKEGKSFVEVYLSFSREYLSYVNNENGYSAQYRLNITVSDKSGKIVDRVDVIREINLPKDADIKASYHLLELMPTELDFGDYTVNITIRDMNNKDNTGELSFKTESIDYWGEKPLLSSIMPVGMVAEADSSIFTRYGMKLLPYPSSEYSVEFPLLKYAHEIYNFDGYKIAISIVDNQGSTVKDFDPIEIPENGVIVNQINVMGLHTGMYDLVLQLVDNDARILDEKRHPFSVNKELTLTLDAETEKSLENMSKMFSFLLSSSEFSRFNSLNPDAQFRFWDMYWSKKPEGDQKKFLENWVYASRAFELKKGSEDGYRTDMGRVYIQYGPPDYIERESQAMEIAAYEKWLYTSTKPNGYFIFGDRNRLGSMELLSSDMPGEIENPNWEYDISGDVER